MLRWWKNNVTATFISWLAQQYPELKQISDIFPAKVQRAEARYRWENSSQGPAKYREWWKERTLLAGRIYDLAKMRSYELAKQGGGSGKTDRGLSTGGAPSGSASSLGMDSRFTFNPRSLPIEKRNKMCRMHQFGNI
jgi:hypothetical protein